MYVLGLFSLERYVFKSAGHNNCSAVLTLSGLSDPFRVAIFKDRAPPHTAPGTGTITAPFSVHSDGNIGISRRYEYAYTSINCMHNFLLSTILYHLIFSTVLCCWLSAPHIAFSRFFIPLLLYSSHLHLPLLHFTLLHFTVFDVGTVSTAAGMSTGMGNGAHSEGSPSNSINFRDLEIGKTETRIIYLKNESDRETHYSILSEENGIFKITGKQGSIPANCNGHPVR